MKIFAQAPGGPPPAPLTPPPAEPAGGAPDLGGMGAMPPMGGMPTAGPESGAPSATQTSTSIYTPLNSLAKILSDASLTTEMKNFFDKNPEETALKIWTDYGGSSDGRTSIHKGERDDKPNPDPEKEVENTKDRKWERLPKGLGIEDITTTNAIAETIKDGYFDLSIQGHKQQGGGGPTAAALNWIKLAQNSDYKKEFRLADEIDNLILNVYAS
jgi:hypothetical protein